MTKKIKKTDLGITLLIIIGILAVLNFLSYQIFIRWDLTENKVYSISKASKKTVSELDDIVNIKAYFSESLPSQVLSIKQEVADVLEEYRAFSNGKIKVEFIDPGDDETLQQELMMIGIPQLTFEVYEKDKMQLVNGYMGIAISFSDQVEVIPAVKQNTSDLEYQITTAIKKVTSDEIATVGFLTSHSTAGVDSEITAAYSELGELYTLRNVELAEEEPEIFLDIDTLVIIGPKSEFNEAQLKAINSFLVRGGSLLVLFDGVNIEQGLLATKNTTGLEGLLNKYGIKINQDLVADTRNGIASFTQGFITFSSNYPFWPKVTQDGFNKDNSAVANLETVIFPWVSSIEIDNEKIPAENVTYLAFTTPKAWSVKDNFNVAPNSAGTPQGTQKSFNLAAAINGNFKNPYFEKGGGEGEYFNSQIIAVGDSEFIRDGFLRNSPDNLTLFQNLVDSLSFDEDLINIRSKGVSSRPFGKELSDSAIAGIRYLNVLGLTIVIIAFGMIRYFLRRRSRFVDEL